jgi:hypothetical protein
MAQVDMHPATPSGMLLSSPVGPISGCGGGGGGAAAVRSRLAPLDTAAVNQNGSFEFDRVVKAGILQKRTQRTKKWKHVFVVLRPTTLSIYKSDKEDRLRHKIYLSDVTAAAHLRDPKHKRNHLFGLFTASRNFHFQAASHADAADWIQLARQGARIEEEEEEMFLASPLGPPPPRRQSSSSDAVPAAAGDFSPPRGRALVREGSAGAGGGAGILSSSGFPQRFMSASPEPASRRRSVQFASPPSSYCQPPPPPESAGNDAGAYSDFSDGETLQQRMHGMSIESLAQSPPASAGAGATTATTTSASNAPYPLAGSAAEPGLGLRNASQASGLASSTDTDPDRVIFQGRIHYLRSKGGVRQWKSTWAVLRPRNLILYKDESEYTAQLIVPMAAIVHVVNIDPLAKTKPHCFQAITEEKTYKFAAADEETLVQCLGAFRSLLAKRRGLEARARQNSN